MTNYTIKTIFVNNYYKYLMFFAATAAVVIMVMVMVMTAIMLVFYKFNGLKLLPYLTLDILNIFFPEYLLLLLLIVGQSLYLGLFCQQIYPIYHFFRNHNTS